MNYYKNKTQKFYNSSSDRQIIKALGGTKVPEEDDEEIFNYSNPVIMEDAEIVAPRLDSDGRITRRKLRTNYSMIPTSDDPAFARLTRFAKRQLRRKGKKAMRDPLVRSVAMHNPTIDESSEGKQTYVDNSHKSSEQTIDLAKKAATGVMGTAALFNPITLGALSTLATPISQSMVQNPMLWTKAAQDTASSMLLGSGVDALSQAMIGKTWGQNINQLTRGYVPVWAADMTNPGYFFGGVASNIANRGMMALDNAFQRGVNRFARSTVDKSIPTNLNTWFASWRHPNEAMILNENQLEELFNRTKDDVWKYVNGEEFKRRVMNSGKYTEEEFP